LEFDVWNLGFLRFCEQLQIMIKQGKDKSKNETAPVSKVKGRSLWICLVFFACVWMFVLGILVGRGTAPVQFDIEKLQKELTALKNAVVKEETLRFKIDSQTNEHKADMSFYEELKQPTNEAGGNKGRQIVKSGPSAKPLIKENASRVTEDKAIEKPVSNAENHSSTKSVALSQAEAKNRFTIQVASLKDPVVADRMVAQLKDQWFPAYKIMANIPGKGIWYRVRIGSFQDKAEAQGTLERLKQAKIESILLLQ
jgi:DedD protein